MRIICVLPPSNNDVAKTFSPRYVDGYLFAHRSDTHLEDAYAEAFRRAYEDGLATKDKVVGLHCEGPNDIYVGAMDGYEAAGCEVQLLEYMGPGEFIGKPRYPKGFLLDPEQAELVMDVIDHRMRNVGHRSDLQAIRNSLAQYLTSVKHFKPQKQAVSA